MKRAIAVLALAFVFALAGIAGAQDGPTDHPLPKTCTAQAFKGFSAAVWAQKDWKRGNPPNNVLEAVRRRENCAPVAHKESMLATWEKDRSVYFAHRKHMIWLETYKPFVYPDGTRWAAPWPIAVCESGENYYASPSGAYGEIPPLPQYQSPRVQDEIAHRLYEEGGEGPWAQYEAGCSER